METRRYTLTFKRSRRLFGRPQTRWNIKEMHSGKIVAEGGEGYFNQEDAEDFPRLVAAALNNTPNVSCDTVWKNA